MLDRDATGRAVGEDPADEWDEEKDDLLYLKYMFEGAASITELSACSGYAHLVREVGS
jgi:hypothetical protein